MAMNDEIMKFYRDEPNVSGHIWSRCIKDFDSQEWDSIHDFIQWVFPSNEPSLFNPDAPILDEETVAKMLIDPDVSYRFNESVLRMKYELLQTESWWRYESHNFRRVTRTIKSISLIKGWIGAREFKYEIEEAISSDPQIWSEWVDAQKFWKEASMSVF